MNEHLECVLLQCGPRLFRDLDGGIATGDGWFLLLFPLVCRLEVGAALQEARGDPAVLFARKVKEKLGGLRFYVSNAPPELAELIIEAERRSQIMCESCSEPGRIRSLEGRLICLCDTHFEEEERQLRDEDQ